VVGSGEERLKTLFAQVDRAATIECGRCMPYENHRPVWICRNLRSSVEEVWPQVKHYE